MAIEHTLNGWPGGMIILFAEGKFYRMEQMVSKDSNEDMPLNTILQMVAVRTQAQIAFKVSEGIFHPG
ncbi:MAG: hypothetical protein V1872_05840 [bacterium]